MKIRMMVVLCAGMALPGIAQAGSVNDAVQMLHMSKDVTDAVETVDGAKVECAYNLDNGKIEVSKAAKDADTTALARCLAPAVAQMKYEDIEATWRAHVGVREAWVIQNGKLRYVDATGKGLSEAAARDTWEVLAVREMTASLPAAAGAARGIASETHADPKVRELLGMQP